GRKRRDKAWSDQSVRQNLSPARRFRRWRRRTAVWRTTNLVRRHDERILMDRRWRSAAWPSRSGFLRKYRDEVMSRLERDSSGGNSGKGGNMEAGDRCASLHALRVSTGGEGKGSVRRLIGWMTCLGVSGLVLWLIETDDAGLKIRLRRIAEMRAFASHELALPSNGSYTRYTDLGRPFVSWTVFATPELSLAARRWCFPIAGCVGYRGYFRETQAQDEALRLQADGDDVYVGHIPAYSTLGYFDDPILSSFVRWPETDVARLISMNSPTSFFTSRATRYSTSRMP